MEVLFVECLMSLNVGVCACVHVHVLIKVFLLVSWLRHCCQLRTVMVRERMALGFTAQVEALREIEIQRARDARRKRKALEDAWRRFVERLLE